MKLVDFLKQVEKIGYDENTELTFGCVDGNTGEYYNLPFKEISYGEELTGKPYDKDEINIEVDVDSAKEYLKDKMKAKLDKLQEDINYLFDKQ